MGVRCILVFWMFYGRKRVGGFRLALLEEFEAVEECKVGVIGAVFDFASSR